MAYKEIYDDAGDGYYDYNPAHALWYVLTSMIGILEDFLDEDSFLAAAETLYEEGRGISGLFRAEQSGKDWILSILNHAEGVVLWGLDANGQPKLILKLIRDDYDADDLPVVDIDTLLTQPTMDRLSWPETLGEVKVQYNKRVFPPSAMRYTQEVVEVLRTGFPSLRVTQEVVEVVRTGDPYAVWYDESFDVLSANTADPDMPKCIEDFVVFLWDHYPSSEEMPPTA